MSSSLGLLAASWGLLMSVSPILQIRTIRRAGSSQGVSTGHLSVLVVGFAIWLAYGVSRGDVPLVATNTVSLTVGVVTLAVARRYRPPTSPRNARTIPFSS